MGFHSVRRGQYEMALFEDNRFSAVLVLCHPLMPISVLRKGDMRLFLFIFPVVFPS